MFKRILLKLSGESLAGENKQGINPQHLAEYAEQIKAIAEKLLKGVMGREMKKDA